MGFRQSYRRFRRNPSPGGGGSGTGNIFNSNWDTAPLGCSIASYSDNGLWTEYSEEAEVCPANVWCDVVSPGFNGSSGRMMRKYWNSSHPTGGPADHGGPEVVVQKNLSPARSEFYLRWYYRWSSSFYFNADCKMLIMGGAVGIQEIYINTYPVFSNTRGGIRVLQATEDRYITGDFEITRGTLYRLEARVRFGTGGGALFEMRVDGSPITWDVPGNASSFSTTDTACDHVKWSTYYNGFGVLGTTDITPAVAAALPFHVDMDEFAIGNEGWIGA